MNLQWIQGSTKLVDYDYTYDRVGNKKTLDVKLTPMMTAVDELYVYDGLHRLTDYDRGSLASGSISSPTLTQDWTLDQTGNWTDFIQGVTGVLNQERTHNKANEITVIDRSVGDEWPTPTYDDNGNMTSLPQPMDLESSYAATWDAWNRLVKLEDDSVTVAEYVYDGLGRRIIKKVFDENGTLSETRHYYLSSSSQVLEERVDSETDPIQQFLWGIRFVDDLVLRDKDTDGNGTLDERLYALADPRFSVVAIVDDTGAVQERYAYDGYGRCDVFDASFGTRAASSFSWEYCYTGRRLDLETGIYFFRARYYHAELGRFFSRDPAGYVDGMSLYRGYMVPNGLDAFGYDWVWPWDPNASWNPVDTYNLWSGSLCKLVNYIDSLDGTGKDVWNCACAIASATDLLPQLGNHVAIESLDCFCNAMATIKTSCQKGSWAGLAYGTATFFDCLSSAPARITACFSGCLAGAGAGVLTTGGIASAPGCIFGCIVGLLAPISDPGSDGISTVIDWITTTAQSFACDENVFIVWGTGLTACGRVVQSVQDNIVEALPVSSCVCNPGVGR